MATETMTKPVDTASLTVSHAPEQASQSEKFARTENQDVGFLSPPKLEFSNQFEEREYIKGRLACAYRVFGHYGLNEGLAGHITVRDPVSISKNIPAVASTGLSRDRSDTHANALCPSLLD